jgi:hypothetical protein
MTAFLEIFDLVKKGDFGLTEEAIYKSIQSSDTFIPVWGGNQEHNTITRKISIKGKTKVGEPINVFDGDGIIISLDGSAGCMTYKSKQKFALNHHGGFFKVKKGAEKNIVPEFFVLFLRNKLTNASISEGSKTLTLDQLYSMDFDFPSFNVQKQVIAEIQPLLEKKNKIESILLSIEKVKERFLSHEYKKYQAKNVPVNEVVHYLSGNSGLTSKFIYQNLQRKGKKYKILSGAILSENPLGEIAKCEINGNPLKVFEGREGILVVRKGKAGTSRYFAEGNYTVTDDAYILYISENCKYEVSLKWFNIQHRPLFFEYASDSDNGTWNMTGFFKNELVDIPSIKEQNEIIELYDKLDGYEIKFRKINNGIENIFSKTLV